MRGFLQQVEISKKVVVPFQKEKNCTTVLFLTMLSVLLYFFLFSSEKNSFDDGMLRQSSADKTLASTASSSTCLTQSKASSGSLKQRVLLRPPDLDLSTIVENKKAPKVSLKAKEFDFFLEYYDKKYFAKMLNFQGPFVFQQFLILHHFP